LKKYENEEYCGQELQTIDEIQYFQAEDYSVLELIRNQNEEFKVSEIQKREITEEQGTIGLCKLLCAVCGAKEKEMKANER
jgi:hypothetical protein